MWRNSLSWRVAGRLRSHARADEEVGDDTISVLLRLMEQDAPPSPGGGARHFGGTTWLVRMPIRKEQS